MRNIDWPVLVQAAQALSALTWLGVSHHYAGSVGRILRRRALPWDGAGCWACVMGLVQTGFTLRWLILGRDDVPNMGQASLQFWVLLYLANAAVAIGILHTWRERDPGPANARARAGLLLWAVVFVASAGLVWSAG